MFGSEGAVAILPSRLLCVWIGMAAASSITLAVLYLPVLGALAASATITAGGVVLACRRALLLSPYAIVSLRFGLNGLDVQFRNGTWLVGREGDSLSGSFVSRWVSLVSVKNAYPRRRLILVLMPDSLNRDMARRLRIWLRWSVSTKSNEQAKT